MTLIRNLWRLVWRYRPWAAALLMIVTLAHAADSTVTAQRPSSSGHLVTGALWLRIPGEDAEASWLEARDPIIGLSSGNRNLFALTAGWELPSGWTPTVILGRLDEADVDDRWKQRPPYRRVRDLHVSGGADETVVGVGVNYRWGP